MVLAATIVDGHGARDREPHVRGAVALVAALYGGWVLATFVLEGHRRLFLHPDALVDRLAYALVANVLIGTAVGMVVVSVLIRRHRISAGAVGFNTPSQTLRVLGIAALVGVFLFSIPRRVSQDPVVVLNVFAQVLPVTVAEVLVCWGAVGTIVEAAARQHVPAVATGVAWLTSAAAFGLYHFAHSPPYDTWPIVAGLSVIGLITGSFFFIARDLYATVLLHNCLAVIGVMKSMESSELLSHLRTPMPMLLATAVFAVVALITLDARLRRSISRGGGRLGGVLSTVARYHALKRRAGTITRGRISLLGWTVLSKFMEELVKCHGSVFVAVATLVLQRVVLSRSRPGEFL